MEACRRRRHTPTLPGIHRLIAVAVTRIVRAADVGRKWDMTVAGDGLPGRERGREAHDPCTAWGGPFDLDLQLLSDLDGPPWLQLATRAHQRVPARGVPIQRSDEQHLGYRTRRLASRESGREDECVVEDDDVARRDKIGKVSERPFLESGLSATDDQESARVALLQGSLRDARLVERVIEVSGAEPLTRLFPS